jgi:hypothetical protein
MAKEEKYSAQYYIDNIPTPISQRLIPAGKRKSVIQAYNSRYHTAKVVLDFLSQRQVGFTPHSQCSPGIAPPDLFLFGHL